MANQRITVDGKFFRIGSEKWYVKGLSYGPFAPNDDGEFLPIRSRLRQDFANVASLGANAIRVYYPPPRWLLDDALEHGLRVFVDVPWEKHRCFFEDWHAQQDARERNRRTARELGDHPGLFAISVANEIPNDIVRFYGHRRIERFLRELIDAVKQEAPNCLTTYVNFPTTEFLHPPRADFSCFNVYLHDSKLLGEYLDRLQHIAADRPLLLGEYGIDSIREGEQQQAALVAEHVEQTFRHGLAGSFVFAYTDDWFTGGHQIDDWAFGITRRDRTPKPSAEVLEPIWRYSPRINPPDLPRVSVVVCTYNGAATLEECLHSLMRLDYLDYEVILVNDGSTDRTAEIARQFPQIVYIEQANQGLGVARNVGAEAATGEVVAYTDDDCVADPDWLYYLMVGMADQRVEAIGGPNIPPPSDAWIAKCVAASPGGPSHVMLDDRFAEHIPGCNMAFYREPLLRLGGFDPQFRQAGDDVDICWRFLDNDMNIGYAPAAVVWHHRRTSLRAYLKQQQGYGRSEAMVHFKHPQRFSQIGRSRWRGVIYGDGAVGLPVLQPLIYHGRFGSAPFQTIYRRNEYSFWGVAASIEWHAIAVFVLFLALLFPPFVILSAAMWCTTLGVNLCAASKAPLACDSPALSRLPLWLLYSVQPVVRGWARQAKFFREKRLPEFSRVSDSVTAVFKRMSGTCHDIYWDNDQFQGRDQLLPVLIQELRQIGWAGDFDNCWSTWDIKLHGDRWHDITINTATEELGWPRRFTRARCQVHSTFHSRVMVTGILIFSAVAVLTQHSWGQLLGLAAASVSLWLLTASRQRCLRAVTEMVWRAGKIVGLEPAEWGRTEPESTASGLPAVNLELPVLQIDQRSAAEGIS